MDLHRVIPTVVKISDILKRNGETVATAESCTAGLVAFYLTAIDGSSAYLKRSFITYCNEAKIELGVDRDTIKQHTVYSRPVAGQMATSAKIRGMATYGIGVTGLCGESDGDHVEGDIVIPAGTVHIVTSAPFISKTKLYNELRMDVSHIPDRNMKRHEVACAALDLFLAHLCLLKEI